MIFFFPFFFLFLYRNTCQVGNHRAKGWFLKVPNIVLCFLGGTHDVSYDRKMSWRNLIYDRGMIRYYVNFRPSIGDLKFILFPLPLDPVYPTKDTDYISV